MRMFAFLFAALLLAGLAVWRGSGPLPMRASSTSSAGQIEVLEISTGSLSLGESFPKVDLIHGFTLKNTNSAESVTFSLTPSCGCTSVSPPQATLQPGERLDVALEIDSTTFFKNSTQLVEPLGVALKAIGKTEGGRKFRQFWEFEGQVRRWAAPIPPVIELTGYNQMISGEEKSVDVALRFDDGVTDVRPALFLAPGEVEVQRREGESLLNYTHPATDEIGAFQGHIELHGTANGKDLPAITIPIYGHIAPPYECLPKQLSFPNATVGQPVTSQVRLFSVRQTPFQVNAEISQDNVDFPVEVKLLQSAEDQTWHEFEVIAHVPAAGNYSSHLIFEISRSDEMPVTDAAHPIQLTLPIRGYGLKATP